MKIDKSSMNTSEGKYDRSSLSALLACTAGSIATLRDLLSVHSYLEVSTNSIGARTNQEDNDPEQDLYPDTCDKLLHSLFSETKLKLDMLAMSLERNCFHVRQKPLNSRELACASAVERLLGQQTHVQLESVYPVIKTEALMDKLIYLSEHLIRFLAKELPERNPLDLRALKTPVSDLCDLKEQRYVKITYEQALQACLENTSSNSLVGADLFRTFGNLPVFVLYPPRTSKQFIYSSYPDSNVALGFDLYLPGTGVVLSGGILSDSPAMLDENLQVQVPGAKPTGAARKQLTQYKKRIERAGPMMRGVIELHLEGVLSSLLRNATLKYSGTTFGELERLPAALGQSKKRIRQLHVPL
jgi:aspartyl/asparaginyl-tRNA synthetase